MAETTLHLAQIQGGQGLLWSHPACRQGLPRSQRVVEGTLAQGPCSVTKLVMLGNSHGLAAPCCEVGVTRLDLRIR